MPAKKATKTANIVANIYEGKFDISFDCVGITICKFPMCSLMPPDGSEECFYNQHNQCLSPHAKKSALEALLNNIKAEIKYMETAE